MIENLKRWDDSYNLKLILIVIIAFILRLYKLNFQSLWSDEVFSLMHSAPTNTLKEILTICHLDVHPPLYPVFLHFWFKLAGYSEFSLRIISVIFGTFGVISVYFLGKAVYDKNAGLFASIITTFTYFHLRYSQEGRAYALIFLLSTLSLLFFIKIINNPEKKAFQIYFTIVSILLIYTHYFGFIVLLSEGIIGLVYLIFDKKDRVKLFKIFSLCAITTFIFYLPWLSVLFEKLYLKGVPIEKVGVDFVYTYFLWYFKCKILVFVSFILIIFASYKSFKEKPNKNLKILLSFFVLTLLIPFLRSLFVPMLATRYTIITLPSIFVLIGISLALIKNKYLTFFTFTVFMFFSINTVFFKVQYFTKVQKEQWREGIEFIEKNNKSNSPVLGNWEIMFNSYSKALGLKTRFSTIEFSNFKNLLNIQLNENKTPEFWLMKGHFDDRIDWRVVKYLKKHFMKGKEVHLAYTHVEQYVGKRGEFTQRAQRGDAENAKNVLNYKGNEVATSTHHSLLITHNYSTAKQGEFTQRAQRGDAENANNGRILTQRRKGAENAKNFLENRKAEGLTNKRNTEHGTRNTEYTEIRNQKPEIYLYPNSFLLGLNQDVQFNINVVCDFRLEVGEVQSRIVDGKKKEIEVWSGKFGDYFLHPLSSYDFRNVLFDSVEKLENGKYLHVLKGSVEPYTGFFELSEGEYFIEFKIVSGNFAKTLFVPIYLKNSVDYGEKSYLSYLKSINYSANILKITDIVLKESFFNKGIYQSFDFDFEDILNFGEINPVLNYLKANNYRYISVSKNSKLSNYPVLNKIVEFEKSFEKFDLYKIDFNVNSENFNSFEPVFSFNIQIDPVILYFNKKKKGEGKLEKLDNKLSLNVTERNSSLMFAFAKDKLWNNNSGYINVENGIYNIEIDCESFEKNTIVYPTLILYNQLGEKIKTIATLPLKIEEKRKVKNLLIKKEYAPFFTNSVKTKKEIKKGFNLPFFKSSLIEFDKNVKKIAIGLYFYKDNGKINIYSLKVNKLKTKE